MRTSPSRPSVCRRGFTLIELVVAMAITALLVSMSVPVALTLLERAREQRTQRQLRQMVRAVAGYGTTTPSFLSDMGRLPNSTAELLECPEPCPGARVVGGVRFGWHGPYVLPQPGMTLGDQIIDGWRQPVVMQGGAVRSDGITPPQMLPEAMPSAALSPTAALPRLLVSVAGSVGIDRPYDWITKANVIDAPDAVSVNDRVRITVSNSEDGRAVFKCQEIPQGANAITFNGLTPGYHLVEACLGGVCPPSALAQCSRLGTRTVFVPPRGHASVVVPLRAGSTRGSCDPALCNGACGTSGGYCDPGNGTCQCNCPVCNAGEECVLGTCQCAGGRRRCAPSIGTCVDANVCCDDSECRLGESCNAGACVSAPPP